MLTKWYSQLTRGLRGPRLVIVILLFIGWIVGVHIATQGDDSYGQNSFPSRFGSAWPGHGTPQASNLASQRKAYSIKPIAYVFPQFHPIPENDKFWGINFTDWVNVKKVTHNSFGLETLRPTEEVGYYNLMDYSTRERYGNLIRDSGFYGIAYHHYWFGRPVMERPLQAILEDGQPNVPFMFSWANEPWTTTWDGLDSSVVLINQTYGGLEEWRAHFDFLLPFFKHPNYIRSNGKVQFMLYEPLHMGNFRKPMMAAWRKWAIDEGLGGLDIIETRIEGHSYEGRELADAINEFGFRSGGGFDHTQWVRNAPIARVYHRGAKVGWDNTPRHATDGSGSSDVWANPDTWKFAIIELMRRMKLEPNPIGEENFLFVNALNEWGEGNVLEPSLQWESRYSRAFREAKDFADLHLPWQNDLIQAGEDTVRDIMHSGITADVCVLIRAFDTRQAWESPWDLPQTFRSLQAQRNRNWRGVVFRTGKNVDDSIVEQHVSKALEPRLVRAKIPDSVVEMFTDEPEGADAVDWVLKNIQDISPSCGSAKYILVTSGTSTYEPDAFNIVVQGNRDIIGLRFESQKTIDRLSNEPVTWDRLCSRFDEVAGSTCQSMKPESEILDLGAAFINQERWLREQHKFAEHPDGAEFLRVLSQGSDPWSWTWSDGQSGCQLAYGETYTSCLRTGRWWVDLPPGTALRGGCHSLYSITQDFGWDMRQWDYERFKKKAYCVRFNEKRYQEVIEELAGVGPEESKSE